jgi:hypothetical protein
MPPPDLETTEDVKPDASRPARLHERPLLDFEARFLRLMPWCIGSYLAIGSLNALLPNRPLSGVVATLQLIVFASVIYNWRRRHKAIPVLLARELEARHGFVLRRMPLVTVLVDTGAWAKQHDVGFVAGDGERLRFYGEESAFSLPRARVIEVKLRPFPERYRPEMRVKWETDHGPRTILFRPKGFLSPWRANRILDSLRLAYLYGRSDLPEAPPDRPPYPRKLIE